MRTTGETTNRAEEVIARCRKLARFSEDSGSTRRTFLSAPMRDCHHEIAGWMEPLGVEVRIDAAGNLRGFYPGAESKAPRLLLGSHLDTVPNAGAYDGVLGVVLAVALLEALDGRRLPFGIEIVGFSEEEGVRFGTPFIGSRALTGRLDEELLRPPGCAGNFRAQGHRRVRLESREIPQAALGDDILGYVEFHIEQGPVLETLKRPLGVVDAIAGQSRLEFTFRGPRQPRRYYADASSPRCDCWRSGVDQRGGAGSATRFQGWWPRWARSRPSPERPTSLPARLG